MSGNRFTPAPQDNPEVPPLQPVEAGPRVGRPRLNRTPEEKREMRRVYMQAYRKEAKRKDVT